MTPLEELQAAYNKLSELRYDTELNSANWHVVNGFVYAGYVPIAGIESSPSHARLIVTLHSTIDAQLAILENAIGHHRSWLSSLKDVDLLPLEVRLARAINGDAS